LSVDGDADAAVEARIRIGWNKFGQFLYDWLPIGYEYLTDDERRPFSSCV